MLEKSCSRTILYRLSSLESDAYWSRGRGEEELSGGSLKGSLSEDENAIEDSRVGAREGRGECIVATAE